MNSRETIYAALFESLQAINQNLVSGAPAIQTFSRRFIPTSRVDLQPALIMVEFGEQYDRPTARGAPNKLTLIAHCFLYTRDGVAPGATPATSLNRLLDSLDATIGPDGVGEQTLGDLVHWVRIIGRQSLYEAMQDVTQTTTLVEIQMLATN